MNALDYVIGRFIYDSARAHGRRVAQRKAERRAAYPILRWIKFIIFAGLAIAVLSRVNSDPQKPGSQLPGSVQYYTK
jgi:hypothetical protein